MAGEEGDVFLQPSEKRDFALLVEGTKVYVDRYYLAYWSPVFGKIFYPEGALFEQPEGAIEMKEKKLDEFLTFLHAVFPSEKTMKVNATNVATLFAYADEYDVKELRERCVEFIQKQLKKKSVPGEALIDYLGLAICYNLKGLQKELVPIVAQLSFDKITAAHAQLPTAVLSAVYQSKALALQTALNGKSAPTLPQNAFRCTSCGSETCTIYKEASSCCNKRVWIIAADAAQIEAQCTFTCGGCSKPCSLREVRGNGYRFSSCCTNSLFVHPKCEVCKKRSADDAVSGPVPKAADFSADLLDRDDK